MATRWKNMIKQPALFIKNNWQFIPGALLIAAGLVAVYMMLVEAGYRPAEESMIIGAMGNLLLAPGIGIVVWRLLKVKYENWVPEDEQFYSEWKQTGRKLDRALLAGGIAGIAAGYLYLAYVTSIRYYGNWYWNYEAGYVMGFTVLIQFIVCYKVIGQFKNRKLELLMEQLEHLNRRRLDVAMEIEKKSLEKVTRSDQLRVDLITNVSHDLKTPLTSMVGYIELIRKEELNDTVRDYVDVISQRAEKLKEMIESLFSLAKASSGNIELHPEKFEVNRMIGQIFADMDDQIKGSGLEFVTRLTKESTELVSDNSYFYRICQNLLENALKYSAKGTRVFVTTYVRRADDQGKDLPGTLCIEFTNTSAYPMDFGAEDIVERFARGDKARSGEGNGLGLAIVSTYTKALGGEFDIRIDCDQFRACVMMPVKELPAAEVSSSSAFPV